MTLTNCLADGVLIAVRMWNRDEAARRLLARALVFDARPNPRATNVVIEHHTSTNGFALTAANGLFARSAGSGIASLSVRRPNFVFS